MRRLFQTATASSFWPASNQNYISFVSRIFHGLTIFDKQKIGPAPYWSPHTPRRVGGLDVYPGHWLKYQEVCWNFAAGLASGAMCLFLAVLLFSGGVVVLLHWLFLRRSGRKTKKLRDVGVQTEATKSTKEVRSVRTQAQCTYKRYLETPRFHALTGRETGAWLD